MTAKNNNLLKRFKAAKKEHHKDITSLPNCGEERTKQQLPNTRNRKPATKIRRASTLTATRSRCTLAVSYIP